MTRYDATGLPIEASAAGVLAWDALVEAVLAHDGATPARLEALLQADPDSIVGHSAKALLLVMLARQETVRGASAAAGEAARLYAAKGGDVRAGLYVSAALMATRGEWRLAIADLDALLDRHPGDALAAKAAHGLRFMLGDRYGMRRSIEAILARIGQDHPHLGYLKGCHAFALEETGDYAAAESLGREAVALAPRDAWGLHAVGHVLEMTGRAEEGVAWLSGREAAYAHCSNFAFHVFWHLALFRLELGDRQGALELYDARIRATKSDDFRDVSNAASLLQRLELDGVAVGSRWEELADIAERRVADGCLVFADLHYLLSLLGAGREVAATALAAGLDDAAGGRLADQRGPAGGPGRLTAEGLIAFRRGDYAVAADHLLAARSGLQAIGGSHAQRDVFEQVTLEAVIRSGDVATADGLLRQRLKARRGSNRFAATRLSSTIDASRARSVAVRTIAATARNP
jgi:tetratricopeptide (TPR) repeat protein